LRAESRGSSTEVSASSAAALIVDAARTRTVGCSACLLGDQRMLIVCGSCTSSAVHACTACSGEQGMRCPHCMCVRGFIHAREGPRRNSLDARGASRAFSRTLPADDASPPLSQPRSMVDDRTLAAGEPAPPLRISSAFWSRALRVALWSVAIGLVLEITLLGIGLLAQRLPDWMHALADTAQKVSWSLLVCTGVSCGLAAHRARPMVMGVLGLLSGPLAFTAAKAVHKGVLQALTAQAAPAAAPMLVPALLKGAEYAAFGVLLGWISRRSDAGLKTYFGGGLAIAIVFGGLILAIDRPPFPDVVLRGANELIFPIGCSFVVYMTNRMVKIEAA
jgi:hypothetical protein